MSRQRLVVWGTYDTGKPRVRLLLEAARAAGFEVHECHSDVWRGVEDKSQLRSTKAGLVRLVRWLLAYPGLLVRYVRLPRHALVLVPYLGLFDIPVIWPFARLRRARLVWDVFLPLYDMVVEDRRLVRRRSLAARLLFAAEALAIRASDTLFLDTAAHASAFEARFRLPVGRAGAVPVGAERLFRRTPWSERSPQPTILFYGQFIPLHGLETLLGALRRLLATRHDVRFLLVGDGQEAARIDAELARRPITGLVRRRWVPYEELPSLIASAWICLGIFGTSQKALSVIPNKVYQVMAVGRPLVTADTPAIREWLQPGEAVRLVPPGDADRLYEELTSLLSATGDPTLGAAIEALPSLGPEEVARSLVRVLGDVDPG